LVDLEDSGSHRDLTYALMERSVGLVHGYFREVAASLSRGEPLGRQVALGRAAERRMLLELGANTHKGAIFLGGLLLAARHRAAEDGEAALRRAIAEVARELLVLAGGREPPAPTTPPSPTHGAEARQRFGVGGILREAAAGLPSLFEVALPAFRAARRAGRAPEAAAFATLASLMRAVEDTTALHRCGLPGLALLREDGRALTALLESGRDHLAFLRERNRAWRALNLTMGGVADLLGMALGWLTWRGELPAAQGREELSRPSGP
jgi:triphosphoribosyl-dephospho-CoA synthase